jgi:hypothetical protein
LIEGKQLSMYLSGQRVATASDADPIRFGKVNAGGWPDVDRRDGGINATVSRYRVFAPPGQQAAPSDRATAPKPPSSSRPSSPARSSVWPKSSAPSAVPTT